MWLLRLGNTTSSKVATLNAIISLHFPQTNRILSAHIQKNGIIPSTKEVHVLSACTVLISGNVNSYNAVHRYGYLPWSIFPLLLGASTGNLNQSFIDTFSVGS